MDPPTSELQAEASPCSPAGSVAVWDPLVPRKRLLEDGNPQKQNSSEGNCVWGCRSSRTRLAPLSWALATVLVPLPRCRGGSPPRLPGPLPSRWRISGQELLISSPEPGGNCVGARRGLCGGRRAGSARGERSQRGSCCFQPPSSPFLPPLGSRERDELVVGFVPPVLGGCDLPRAVP